MREKECIISWKKTDDIPTAFADVLGGLLSVVGQNVVLKIHPVKDLKIKKVWTKYPITENSDGSYSVKLSDLYSEERRDTICRVLISKIDSPQDKQDLVSFSVEYFNVLTSQMESMSSVSTIARPTECDTQVPDFFLDRERNRLLTLDAMVEARKLGDASQLTQAKQLLLNTVEKLKSAHSAEDPQTQSCIKDLMSAHADMISKEQYKEVGSKKMAWKEQKFAKQRAVADSADYENDMKFKMKKAYMDQKAQMISATPTPTTTTTTDTSSTTSVTTSPSTSSIPSNRRSLQVGNAHTYIPDDQAEESKVTPGQKLNHEWTLYVRGFDVSFIAKVEFTIHSTFTPNVIEVHNTPFEITRKGWGFFNCKVRIFYKTGAAPTEVIHMLSFDGNGNFKEIVVDV